MEEAAQKDGRACGGPDTKDVPDDGRAGGYAQTKGASYETKGVSDTRAGGYAQTKGVLNTHAGGETETTDVPGTRGGTDTQTKGVSG
jgi:hypothetical protein